MIIDDRINFDSSIVPTGSGQIGMNLSTGRPEIFIDGQARGLAHENEVPGSGIVNKITTDVQPENWIKYGAGTDIIEFFSNSSKQARGLFGTGTNQVGTHRKRVQIPGDFVSFKENGLRVQTRRIGAVDSMTLSMFKDGVIDPGASGVSILPSGVDVFEQFEFTPSGSYSPHDFILLSIETVVDITELGEFADVEVRYNA